MIVSGSVYESGGRPVSRSLKRTLWPAAQLVGVPLLGHLVCPLQQRQVGLRV